MVAKLGVVLENDGEVATLIPLSKNRLSLDHRRASVLRRAGMTREEFQDHYAIMDGAVEARVQVFDALGITEKELNDALQRARTESAECQNLLKLVRACRKKRTAQKQCQPAL